MAREQAEQQLSDDDPDICWDTSATVSDLALPPRAFDLVFLTNFLTQLEMTSNFERELEDLGRHLTPGGLLCILGGRGGQYPEIYEALNEIATRAGLQRLPLRDSFKAGHSPASAARLALQERSFVYGLSQAASGKVQSHLQALPQDLLDQTVPFHLPNFHFVAYKREGGVFPTLERRRRGNEELHP